MNIDKLFHGRVDIEIRRDEPMGQYSGFRAGGRADYFAVPKTADALLEIIDVLNIENIPYFFLGNGSNVLVRDEGYHGWILKTDKALPELEIPETGTIRCGAGVLLSKLCESAAERGWTGLEFAYGIPGTLGGAIFMNAGAYDGEIRDIVESVVIYDMQGKRIISNAEMEFGYRASIVQRNKALIVGATLKLRKGDRAQIQNRMAELLQQRKNKQPLAYPSCGSTFKRPAGNYASKLIDDCGLRGFTIGGAQVSEQHCGFLINRNDATAAEILKLIELVRETVFDKTGYQLECEVQVIPSQE